MTTVKSLTAKEKRVRRVRSKLMGTEARPRLSVHRTNLHLHAQLIDDQKKATLLGLSTKSLKLSGSKLEQATALGEAFGAAAGKVGVKEAVFDRGRFRFHGRVKAFAAAARKAGLKI